MERVVFIGTVYPRIMDNYYKALGKSNVSNVVFNDTLVTNLEKQNIDLKVLSAVGVGHFPIQSKKLFIREQNIKENYSCVKYCNLLGWNVYSKSKSLYKKAKQFKVVKENNLRIIVSEASIPFLKAAKKIKNKSEGNKITLIVFDLPEQVLSDKKISFYNWLKRRSTKKLLKLYKCVDNFVFLTEEMNKSINLLNKPYFVFPGVADLDTYKNITKESRDTLDLCYCGTISKRFDIDFLIDSFKLTNNPNFRLRIAGGGEGVEYVKEQVQIDKRIEYLGILNRESALQLQLSSDCLINPRLPTHDYSKFSFPSKIMNYLLTFNPVISYKTDAFPEDISSLLIIPDDYQKETLAKTIESLTKGFSNSKEKVRDIISNYSITEFTKKLLSF